MVEFPKVENAPVGQGQMMPPILHPQQQGGGGFRWAHTLAAMGTGGAFFLLIVVATQAFMPEAAKPSTLWGNFTGDTEATQIAAVEAVKVEYERKIAEVTANEQMKAQAELARVQQGLQAEIVTLQSNMDTTKEAYASLYRRTEILAQGFMQMQGQNQQMRNQIMQQGNVGASLVNMGTSFMCSMARAQGSDPQGHCAMNDRVRSGQMQDSRSTGVSAAQLHYELFGGLPDPATARTTP